MNKNTIKIVLVTLVSLIIATIAYYKFINTETDAIKFKKEYESYNNKINDNNIKYNKITINSNNKIKYSNYEEIFDILENGIGIIYLGFPTCPWCRTMIPILIDVANDYDVENIYYINIKDDRDQYEVQNNKLVYSKDENNKEMKGNKNYFKLIKKLDSWLTDYIIELDGIEYNTNEKRIYAPTVIFVKNGNILGLHVSTIESQKNGYDKLTYKQKKELYEIYEAYVIQLNDNTCKIGDKC